MLIEGIAASGRFRLLGLRLFQRQQLHKVRGLGQHGHETGVGNIDFVVLPGEERPANLLGDGKAVADAHGGGLRIALGQNGDTLILKAVHGLLADGKDSGLLSLNLGINQLENIAVIAAGKTPVACNDEIENLLSLPFLEIGGGKVPIGSGDVLDGSMQDLKIGAGSRNLRLGAPKLGGRDHFHGLGDLLGAFHAADAVFDFLGGNASHGKSSFLMP